MKRLFFAALSAVLLCAGCANTPSTGPVVNSANRMEVVLTTNGPIDPRFYYAVAFDDQTGDGQGPTAIVGNTSVLNGVVGGNFRLAVLYNLNSFQVFYRSDPTDPASERQVLDSPFFTQPVATTNGIQFTLDLDAQLSNGNFFFPRNAANRAPDRIDLNFVTTSTILRSAQDNRIKPIDSFGPATASTPIIDFQIAATRRIDNPDPANDQRLNVDPSFTTQSSPDFANFGNLDVTDLQINITRNRNAP